MPAFCDFPTAANDRRRSARQTSNCFQILQSAARGFLLHRIDGRECTWEEFGRMRLSFEGWQFRLEVIDRTEEV